MPPRCPRHAHTSGLPNTHTHTHIQTHTTQVSQMHIHTHAHPHTELRVSQTQNKGIQDTHTEPRHLDTHAHTYLPTPAAEQSPAASWHWWQWAAMGSTGQGEGSLVWREERVGFISKNWPFPAPFNPTGCDSPPSSGYTPTPSSSPHWTCHAWHPFANPLVSYSSSPNPWLQLFCNTPICAHTH